MRKSSLYFLPLSPQSLNFPKSNHNSQFSTLNSQLKVVPLHPVRVRWGRVKCVEIQGQQFKAEEGKKLFVHHIKDAEEGKTVEFDKVLLVDADGAVTVGAPTVKGAKVVCEVVNPLVKGDKVIVFKMKRRKDSRKRNGHREQFTQLEIKSVIA